MPATFHIEQAKSGRSKCKKCKEVIHKGSLRIGNTTERLVGDDSISMTSWTKLSCFSLPRNFKKEGVTPSEFVENHLNDPDDILNEHMKEVVLAITANSAGGAKKKKTKENDSADSKFLAKVKRNAEVLENDEAQPSKRVKEMSELEKKEAKLFDKFKKMTIEQLKDYMRWNRQIVGGTKPLLLLKCLDGALRGRLGRCPMCARAKLKIADASSEVAVCAGYFDEEAGMRVPACTAVSLKLQGEEGETKNIAPRLHPWFSREPTEEEAKELDDLDEQAASGKIVNNQKSSAASSNEEVLSKLLKKADNIPWNVGSKSELKATAAALLQLGLDGGLALPSADDGGTKAVGRILVSNRSIASCKKVFQLLVDEFGFAAEKAQTKKDHTAAITNLCQVSANVGCYEMLDEFSKLSRKSGDFRKANSYRTAAQAIAGLKMEITASNALSLGKSGKNKVAGIGKSISEKIHEFLETGTVEKLEELRAT